MFTTVITDCWGENEKGRQIARYNSLGLGPTDLVGVSSDFSADATIEGGANLIDILDATGGKKGVVVLNVAPRGDKNEGTNGNSFCYFYYKKTLVITTIKGYCLSLIKRFGITKRINIIELSEVLNFAKQNKFINNTEENYIVTTQFRSFDFIPRLALWITNDYKVPSKKQSLSTIPVVPSVVWHIDAFGNAKTTLTNKDVPQASRILNSNFGKFNFYQRLKDVPRNEVAMYIGSSGIGNVRFLEIAKQATPGSAAKALKLKIGDTIEFK